MATARVRVPATSANLGPGFDTLGLALKLYNFVTIRDWDEAATDNGGRVLVTGEGAGSLHDGDDNIAWIAARRLLEFVGAPGPAFQLEMNNHIPLSRGLGSSAAARVGALVAANEWARLHGWRTASPGELVTLATQLEGHPDNVAPALLGGLVVAVTGVPAYSVSTAPPEWLSDSPPRDSLLETVAIKMEVAKFPKLLVLIPDDQLATEQARAALPDVVFHADAVFNVSRAALLLAALATGQFDALHQALHDRLHQEYRAELLPGLGATIQAAIKAGAYGATLSGAGPSVLAWLPPNDAGVESDVRSAIRHAAAEHEVFGRVIALEVDYEGAVILPDDAKEQSES
jgi:homoserine kinase